MNATPKHPAQIFGDTLTRYRIARDLTRADVADRVGCRPRRVAAFEEGTDAPDARIWARYCNMVARGLREFASEWRAAKTYLAEHGDAPAEPEADPGPSDSWPADPAAYTVIAAPPLPSVTNAPTFDEALRRARLISGLSARDIAELVEVPEATFHAWDQGSALPADPHMSKLLELYPDLARWQHAQATPPSADLAYAATPRFAADIPTVLAMVTAHHETIAAEPRTSRPRHDQWFTEVNPKPLPSIPVPVIATPLALPLVKEALMEAEDTIAQLARQHTEATLAWVKTKRERARADAAYRVAADARDRAVAAEALALKEMRQAQHVLETAVEEAIEHDTPA